MARPRVILSSAGVRALLTSAGVEADLQRRAVPVLAAARATAPVESGAYRESLTSWSETHTGRSSRVAVHVGATVDYGVAVEGAHGTLSRALDAMG